MLAVSIRLPPKVSFSKVAREVERRCAREGLRVTLKGTLAKYPGCVHWHFKKGAERGTLEVTLWEQERRLWFKVHAGRRGAWMEAVIPRLQHALQFEWASRT
jgi:hypothetical protein